MIARRILFLALLALVVVPSNLKLAFAEGRPILTFVCHDNNWEDSEYCGRDALVATGVPDMNHDCVVDGLDFALFTPEYAGFGSTGPALSGDFNNDGAVNTSDYSLLSLHIGDAAVPCNPTAVPVVCDGILALSFNSDPNNIVYNSTANVNYVGTAYVVVDGVTNATWFEFTITSSPNITVLGPATQEHSGDYPGSFATCNNAIASYIYPATPVTGKRTVAKVTYWVRDQLPGFISISPQTCPLTRNRWLTADVPQISHEFGTVSSVGINGPTPGVTPSCVQIGTVTGNVFSDSFIDCLFDADDTVVSGRRIVATPGPYFAYTDNAGNYAFSLSAGTYRIAMANYNDPWKKLSPCQEPLLQVAVTANAVTSGVNIALKTYGTIKGRVYRDFESSTPCTFDGTDFPIPGRLIQATSGSDGPFVTSSDENGNYELNVPVGFYTVSQVPVSNDPWAPQTCSSASYSVPALPNTVAGGNDFPLRIVAPTGCAPSVDIVSHGIVAPPPPCSFYLRGPCPGNVQEYIVVVKNGVLTSTPIAANSIVDVTLDAAFTIGSVTSAASVTTLSSSPPNHAQIRLNNAVNPGATVMIAVHATPAGAGPYTHNVSYDAAGTCAGTAATLSEVARCSCDPNAVAVQPGCGVNNEVQPGKTLTYTVHFENVGSGPAHNIYINDVLDADVDPTSAYVVSSSHNVTGVQFDPGNKLVISFDGIDLPALSTFPNNRGYVIFSVEQKPARPDGTAITNSAAITFDFNPPVVTNTVTSIVETNPCSTTGVDAPEQPTSQYLGQNYPNPFNPATTIDYAVASPELVSIAIYNVRGELIRTLVSENKPAGRYSVEWDGRDQAGNPVASGVYVSRMSAGSFSQTKKLVLLK